MLAGHLIGANERENMADQVFAGTVVLPDRMIDNGHVLVADGLVQAVGSGPAPAGERHGGTGFFVFPGAIDAQVHSRSQKGQEDFIWSTRSAAAGGVTTIVDMPYDDGCLIANAERFRIKAKEAGAQARVDFALYATVDPQEGASRIGELVDAGAAAFKFSTFGTHPQRFPRIPPQTLFACFEEIGPRGLIAGIHNENDEMVRAFTAKVEASDITDYRAHGLRARRSPRRWRPQRYTSSAPVRDARCTSCTPRSGAATNWPRPIARRGMPPPSKPASIILRSMRKTMFVGSAARPRSIRRCGRGASVEALWHHLVPATSRSCRPTM